MPTPENCPQCGADVPRNARACPECGSSEETGWSEEARADGLDLPGQNFDYQDFVEREFAAKKSVPRGMSPFWCVAALVVLVIFIVLVLR